MNPATLAPRTADLLAAHAATRSGCRVVIGLDGFVDEICSVVDQRESAERFTRVPTLAAFADRIARATARSANAELVIERVKLGGNGPIMANALAAFGVGVTYLGNLGYPTIHPAFAELCRQATVYSIAEPGHTDALEFDDGKLLLGKHAPLRDVTWMNLVERVGRDRLVAAFADASLIGLQNWTMLPHLSDIWQHVLDEICPCLEAADADLPLPPRRRFFFDLADPEKRDPQDIRQALGLIGRFQQYGDTYLGLNERESLQIAAVLGYAGPRDGATAIRQVAKFTHDRLAISAVVIHPRAFAVTAAADGVCQVNGPFTPKPLISTGAGDHFNAGFCLGKLIDADDAAALQLGVATSGYYVRSGKSPTATELAEFLRSL